MLDSAAPARKFTVQEKHAFRKNLCCSAVFWAAGNSFTSAGLFIFLGRTLGYSSGQFVSWFLAAGFLGGLLRLLIPLFLKYFPKRKRAVQLLYAAQVLFLLLLLLSVTLALPISNLWRCVLMVTFFTLASASELTAFMFLNSWIGALFTRKALGRFYSQRERFRICGQVFGIFLLGVCLACLREGRSDIGLSIETLCWCYVGVAFTGIMLILYHLRFFNRLPEIPFEVANEKQFMLRENVRRFFRPMKNPVVFLLLIYSAAFSFFVQLEQTPTFLFTAAAVPFCPFLFYSFLRILCQLCQMACAAKFGVWIDRYGALKIMCISQFLTAVPLLFFFGASCLNCGAFWFLSVAYIFWASYVGLNIGLPKIQLEYGDPKNEVPFMAVYGAIGSACGGAAILLGGKIFDVCGSMPNFYPILFALAFFWRAALAIPLYRAMKKDRVLKLSVSERESG